MENVTDKFLEKEPIADVDLNDNEFVELNGGKGTEEEEREYYEKTGKPSFTKAIIGYTNSPLVDYMLISPNRNSPRNNVIDTITIHMVVGQCTVEALGSLFFNPSRQASSNYGVGYDGRIGMYCPESDRSWCSSSPGNDNRAITIETASDTYHPFAVNSAAYDSLIKLCADICKRNGKTKMVWCGTAEKTNARKFESYEMRMTLHKWFAETLCPGEYLESHMAEIANKVNKLLNNHQIDEDGDWGKQTTILAQRVYGCKTINGLVVHQKKSYKAVCPACNPDSWCFTGTNGYSPLIAKIQKELGISYKKSSKSYGRFTKKTRKYLQKKLGTKVDGKFKKKDVVAFQKYINKKAKQL